MIQTIQLVDILLHGYHGLFEEEKLVGNTFKINVTVVYEPSSFPITQLADTIDYGAVFSIWDRLLGTFSSLDIKQVKYGLDRYYPAEKDEEVMTLLTKPFKKLEE